MCSVSPAQSAIASIRPRAQHEESCRGTLTGPNLELLSEVCAATNKPVVASGGVSTLDDLIAIRALTSIGVEGSIVGKALYAGAFTLQQALEVSSK